MVLFHNLHVRSNFLLLALRYLPLLSIKHFSGLLNYY